ncbi:MAG: AMP-binding protein, partial [Lentisphaerota bacterium]
MTIKELLAGSIATRGDSVVIRHKQDGQWAQITYSELEKRVWNVAEILASRLGIKPGDRVAIFRENAPDWPELYLGIVGIGATAVPIDAKLQEQEVAHILHDSGARALFSGARNYALLRDIDSHVPNLANIILIGGQEVLPAVSRKIKYWDYEDLCSKVKESALSSKRAYDRAQPKDDDIASLIYTSGTTGRQKGAMLTHRNFTANVEGCKEAILVKETDNFLLVLPLHHSFAFTANLLLPIAAGAEISLVESLKTVGENIREVSPTILIGVPLLFEKMYNRIWNGLKENKVGYSLYELGIMKPVLRGIREKLGGQLRLVVSGGAPCDPDLLVNFNRLGVPMIEGYGLTETAPVLTLNPMSKPKPGSVGIPLPNGEIRIAGANEDGVGEITARAPSIMKGYFNNPEATASVFKDGWFLTGDLGFIDSEGYVKITGRKKSLIVNREGKNIYPEEVEHQICKSPFIREALALGYREADEKVGEHVGLIAVPDQ